MRYIDADAFKRKLIDEKSFFPAIVARALEEMPTADVVPKSEVEWLYQQIDNYSQEVMYHDEITKMKVDEAKTEVAREIFEEIERNIINSNFEFMFVNKKYFAKLKKKYLGEKQC